MNAQRLQLISSAVLATLLVSCNAGPALQAAGPAAANRTPVQDNTAGTFDAKGNSQIQLMVTVRNAAELKALQANAKKLGFTVTKSWPQINAASLRLDKFGAVGTLSTTLKDDFGVLTAQPAGRIVLEAEPNDPELGNQYGMQLMNVVKAWETQPGKAAVKIAMIDTGIDLTHPDLKDKIVEGYNATAPGQSVADDNGHGSHTAGIAAAAVNNGAGVIGVGGGCSIMPVKVLSNGGGSEESIADGVIWAADHGANVMSMSIGLYKRSPVFEKALQYALDKGVTLVASAGNSNKENDPTTAPHLPSTYPGVIEVAATDANDKKASFSNFGKTVSVAAPGVDVLSTYMGGIYKKLSGTSMACPHVAGLAGLVISQNPGIKPAAVKSIIERSAKDFGAAGFDPIFGFGRADAAKAVATTRR
ncbi:MAG: S8 family serine peptidase [Candidatus Sericytochromatia bacterium]|nr:S8 family serine peptidase [Candidatus Sericytochromatia bacterium]